MRKILISAALLTAAAAAVPAAAQYGSYNRGYDQGYGYNHGQNIRSQINQLRQRIDQLARRGLVSRNEASRLFHRADELDFRAQRFARNGISPREHQELQARIHDLRQRIQSERREGRRDSRRRWN